MILNCVGIDRWWYRGSLVVVLLICHHGRDYQLFKAVLECLLNSTWRRLLCRPLVLIFVNRGASSGTRSCFTILTYLRIFHATHSGVHSKGALPISSPFNKHGFLNSYTRSWNSMRDETIASSTSTAPAIFYHVFYVSGRINP